MMYGMYVIFDRVANEAGFPFDAKNDDVAKRRFEDIINRQIRPVKTVSVDDYELHHVGQFDSEACSLIPNPGGSFVCFGSDVSQWPQEEIDKLSRPSPSFNMEDFRKQVAEMSAAYAKRNPPIPASPTPMKKKWFKWFKK